MGSPARQIPPASEQLPSLVGAFSHIPPVNPAVQLHAPELQLPHGGVSRWPKTKKKIKPSAKKGAERGEEEAQEKKEGKKAGGRAAGRGAKLTFRRCSRCRPCTAPARACPMCTWTRWPVPRPRHEARR